MTEEVIKNKIVKTRMSQKHEFECHWKLAEKFIPMEAEWIIYNAEVDAKGNVLDGLTDESRGRPPFKYPRLKLGDGKTFVNDLPFYDRYRTFIEDSLDDLNGVKKIHGDIAIIESSIGSTGKTSRTAYTWDEDKNSWIAFDGNYSAENVYLDGTVKLSGDYSRIGNITKSSNAATADYNWNGKSIKEFLTDLLSQVLYPSKPTPSVSMTLSNAGSKEIGTTITPSYTVTYDPKTYAYGSVSNNSNGSYTYAPPSNVTIDIVGGSNASTSGTMTGSGNAKHTLTLTDDAFVVDLNTSYYGTSVNCSYGDGAIPYTNVKTAYEAAKVTAGTATNEKDTSKITGYREGCFYGTVSTAGFDVSDITNSVIRGLSGKTGKNYASGTYNFTIPVGATAVIVACPEGKTGATEVLNTTVNAKYTTLVGNANIAKTLYIGGANSNAIDSITEETKETYHAIKYNVWVFIPTEAFGASADVKLTLGA